MPAGFGKIAAALTCVGDTAKSIRWSGGRCRLTNKLNPLDGGANWCGQAVITPKRGQHEATIEVFFEKPAHGKAGAPFAFRAIADTKDGPDYMRETFSPSRSTGSSCTSPAMSHQATRIAISAGAKRNSGTQRWR